MQELNEAEMFRTVLNEMLGELKQLTQGAKETNKNVATLQEKFGEFHHRLENLQVIAPAVDLAPVHDSLTQGVSELNKQVTEGMQGVLTTFTQHLEKLTAAVEAQPKRIVRRISLFPENDRHGNYKYTIRTMFLSILGALVVGGAFSLLLNNMEERKEERRKLMFQKPAAEVWTTAPPAQAAAPPQKKKTKAPVKSAAEQPPIEDTIAKPPFEDTTARTDY